MPLAPRDPLPTRRPMMYPTEPPRRGRHNKLAFFLAIGVALVFVPLTNYYQSRRAQELRAKREAAHPTPTPEPKTIAETGDQSVPAELRQWHMEGVDGTTEAQARKRFGEPVFTRDYNTTYGAFLGPKFGLKHYFLNNSPGFDQREKGSDIEYNYPRFSAIREMIWKMRESYLTVWMYQPPVEISLTGENGSATFPKVGKDDWVVVDNYRVGQDLIKNPPVATTPKP